MAMRTKVRGGALQDDPPRRTPSPHLRRQWQETRKPTMGMGNLHDQSAEIQAVPHSHNWGTTYGISAVGNTYRAYLPGTKLLPGIAYGVSVVGNS